MRTDEILILRSNDIASALEGRERAIVESVADAYVAHDEGASCLPHSAFLRFPHLPKDRIIALPAYLGGAFDVAGIKWIASFPENHDLGLDRASATIVLNSLETGRPLAFLEGSIISAKRTAASAALAARTLHDPARAREVGFVGTGPINFEVARFVLSVFPEVERLVLFDTSPANAARFARMCAGLDARVAVETVDELGDLFARCALVSLATTAASPHVFDLSRSPEGATILHVSLRDLSADVILSSDNVVDDVDHVCRAQTSIDLASQASGDRSFVRATLGQILRGAPARPDPKSTTIFSPFGLGVLDMALTKLVYTTALERGLGTAVADFFPSPWGSLA